VSRAGLGGEFRFDLGPAREDAPARIGLISGNSPSFIPSKSRISRCGARTAMER